MCFAFGSRPLAGKLFQLDSCMAPSAQPISSSVQIFNGVSFRIAAGKKVAVMGSSGCGKSVLLKVLLGLSALS
jgi:ABC-type lipoprotein export system ATPase subunit